MPGKFEKENPHLAVKLFFLLISGTQRLRSIPAGTIDQHLHLVWLGQLGSAVLDLHADGDHLRASERHFTLHCFTFKDFGSSLIAWFVLGGVFCFGFVFVWGWLFVWFCSWFLLVSCDFARSLPHSWCFNMWFCSWLELWLRTVLAKKNRRVVLKKQSMQQSNTSVKLKSC